MLDGPPRGPAASAVVIAGLIHTDGEVSVCRILVLQIRASPATIKNPVVVTDYGVVLFINEQNMRVARASGLRHPAGTDF